MNQRTPYSFGRIIAAPFAPTVDRLRAALQEQGFGILSEINVQEKLREKLQVSFRPYLILGACNPPLAHRALSAEPDLGTLLPCNVVVYAEGDDSTVVTAMDPVAILGLVDNPEIAPIARQVRQLLKTAMASL